MKNRIWNIVLLVSLLLMVALPAEAQPAPTLLNLAGTPTRPHLNQPTSSQPAPAETIIRGRVLDSLSQPQPRLLVQAILPGGQIAAQAHTSPEGGFVLADLPEHALQQPLRLQVLGSHQKPFDLQPGSRDRFSPAELQRPRFHELTLTPSLPSSPLRVPRSAAPASPAGTGQITGLVTADDTGLPLQSVYVSAYKTDGDYIGMAFTNSSGEYTLTGLDTASYKVRFDYYDGNYVPEWYNNQIDLTHADPIPVTDGATTPNIDAVLEVGGLITGTVTAEEDGSPLENINIYVYTLDGAYVNSGYTDSSGQYTINSLGAGNYLIEFVQHGTDAAYLSEWYNNQATQDEADPVVVSPPEVTPNINAALEKGGGISGAVTAQGSGDPLQNVNVDLYDSSGDYVAWTAVNADGLYTFTLLASGVYHIRFDPYGASEDYVSEYYDDQPDLLSADPITVTAPAYVTGIDASLALGAKITGQVTGSDTSLGLPDVDVYAYDCYGFVAGYAETDASGYYTVTGLSPGGYQIGFSPDRDGDSRAYLREYYNNKSSLDTADIVTVASGETKSGIDAALTRGGQISGKITAADSGLPLDDVDIEIYDSTGDYRTRTSTDANGVYTTTGMTSGNYKMWVSPWFYGDNNEYAQEYYNDKTTMEDATLIQVTQPNLTSGVDIVLSLGGSISGQVSAAGSATGLRDVYVDVYGRQSDFWIYNDTDASGNYTVHGIPSGAYRIHFYTYGASDDYVREYYEDVLYWDEAITVTVTAPADVPGINAELALGGKIECNVKAEDTHLPLEGAYVDAYDSQGYYRHSASTDQNGDCVLPGLPSDDYTVYFDSYRIYSYHACITTITYYNGEYYNDKPDYDSANPITVLAPNTVTGINALLSIGQGPPPQGWGDLYLPMIRR
jgi:hypothetical protein